MKISVCCPSYKRPIVKTLKYLPFCKVYVDDEEDNFPFSIEFISTLDVGHPKLTASN